MFFETLGRRIGSHNSPPAILSKALGILGNRAERQIVFPGPSCQVCQETATLGMLDQTPGFVNIELAWSVTGEDLCPDKVGNQKDAHRPELFPRHLPDIKNNQM